MYRYSEKRQPGQEFNKNFGWQQLPFSRYTLCNFFGVQTDLAELACRRNIETAEIESVFPEIFLFVRLHIQIVDAAFVYLEQVLRITLTITDGRNDGIKITLSSACKINGFTFYMIYPIIYITMFFADEFDRSDIQ